MKRDTLFILLPFIILIHSCSHGEKKPEIIPPEPLLLTIEEANNLDGLIRHIRFELTKV